MSPAASHGFAWFPFLAWTLLISCGVPSIQAQNNTLTSSNTPSHWSLKPIIRPTVPPIPNRKWKALNPIDHFVFQKLAESNLSPSPEASRHVLIRRLYFDLIGLPPSPEEVVAFENDKGRDAYEKVVDRLLASPRYGERWAAHWLDVVRFAESHGFEMNQPRPNAWPYRDYVIRALNEDKPYDRFIREQFAGDFLGEDAATGFLVAGGWDQVKSPDPVLTAAQRADELHDMVSTTGSAFLGLTVGCARCHNHKFDPIPQVDYYAIKACLAGVEHGERKLRTPQLAAQEQELDAARKKLEALDLTLTQFEPIAFTSRLLILATDAGFNSKTLRQLQPASRVAYLPGNSRGARDDPGDVMRMPNFSHGFLAWSNAADADLFWWKPGLRGTFHLWLGWGCGLTNYARDARYILDRDGDLATKEDQVEIARVDQRHYADGAETATNQPMWSGFYYGGSFDLAASNKLVLRGGTNGETVTAAAIALLEGLGEAASDPVSGEVTARSRLADHFLRPPVNPRRNVERFAPVLARRLRFTITRTTDAEPCIDELEVYAPGGDNTNLALRSAGVKAAASSVYPNSDIHRLEHLNDGQVGNSHSWISNERGKGWVELEFPREVTIDRVIWGRDREQQFSDRLALEYRIEVSASSNDWRLVASSEDRVPYNASRPATPGFDPSLLAAGHARTLTNLLAQRPLLETRIKELADIPMVYAGKLIEKPEPTPRLQRGDPMQPRETVEPGVLSAVPVAFRLPRNLGPAGGGDLVENTAAENPAPTPDQQRRLALADWIANPANPLPARVMVNRLWQHHFGEGLVSTPSDFGVKGSKPSHPDLLDWLAAEFIAPIAGSETAPAPWSLKHLHRLMVTSAVYRQASASRPGALAADAGSRLLWRFPPQRLDAEPLRDAILAISGKLDLRAGGPGFNPFEPNDNYVRVYNPKKEFGPPDWRRMVYMTRVRMQPDAIFGAFDCPDGGQIAPKRMRSITPLQALNLLNSEFILQQSRFFAKRLETEAGNDPGAQVSRAFTLAYARSPDPQESKAARAVIAKYGLPAFCRALFNSNEFVFVE